MKNKLSQEDLEFLHEVNSPARGFPVTTTLKANYIRQFDRPILVKMEAIAKKAINPDFVLCYHCPNEVFGMVKKLYALYEGQQPEPEAKAAPAEEPGEIPPVTLGETEDGEQIVETIKVTPKPKGKPGRKSTK